MLRAITTISGILFVVLVANACTGIVPLTQGHYPPQIDTGEVEVIDVRDMERTRVERILSDHIVISRFDVRIPQGDDFEQRLADAIEKGKTRTLRSGGRVLLLTDNSEMIAVIKQDARYGGALDAITMYVMLRRM